MPSTRAQGSKHPSLNELFRKRTGAERKHIRLRYWGVRQLAGPQPHKDLVISAIDSVDAARQWFCYYGLTGRTYRYRLTAVELPSDHPAVRDAIECHTPRSADELTLDRIQESQFDDVEHMIKTGQAQDVAS